MIRFLSSGSQSEAPLSEIDFQRLKSEIHQQIVESLDLSLVAQIDDERMRDNVRNLAQEAIRAHRPKVDKGLHERLQKELQDEVFGLGPLEPLMEDPTISDILVNNAHEIFLERHGRLERTDIVFADDAHLMRIIQRVVARVGRRIDEVSPMVDARLADGSRINAIVPPLALNGPKLSIRRFGVEHLQLEKLLENDTLDPRMVAFLSAAVAGRVSFMISGGTGAGKTTMLNALSKSIPEDERIVTIEDSAELLLQHAHVVGMETRPANSEGQGAVTPRDLVRNSLRMRPDRILVGEVRGAEALDMLQAMNTGHEGSLTTIHANDAVDALHRLEMMVAMAGYELPIGVVRRYVASGIRVIVHVARLKGGVRKVMRVAEITGSEGGEYQLNDIFKFEHQGLDADGKATGRFVATGYQPRCLNRFQETGIEIDSRIFQAS
ncbi:CpaF family protein [Blastopirellula marina]|uniref:Pilus assembly protein CpaF n=1 Tax=Blastopirellula marina TaxID=124 RepID=A0A2S8GCX1_9BACT|nr:CpaF family protein [Blastopirellula marina]PQO42150.1 pilus assembly protein CpaF [Blastopirellula marina]